MTSIFFFNFDASVVVILSIVSSCMASSFAQKPYEETQNLAISPCSHEGEVYCQRKVVNSVCSLDKDECFCRKGYVSIQEEEGITCKTLLTDLKCRLDSDCRHASGSTCHPGAGACACPGGTEFVPQLNSCKTRVPENFNKFCQTCSQFGGICFKQNDDKFDDLSPNQQSLVVDSKYPYGCICPKRNAMPIGSDIQLNSICRGFLGDISDFCNNEDLLCRSSYAHCNGTSNSGTTVCTCPSGHIPVYQHHLRYYECFPKISGANGLCSSCVRQGGECYDMNNDKVPDGCVCSRHKSHRNPSESLTRPCSQTLIHVSCQPYRLRVCYRPHHNPPYETLLQDLLSRKAVAFLSGRPSSHEEQCLLRSSMTNYNGREVTEFCVEVNLKQRVHPCGLYSMKYRSGYLYGGHLEIWTDSTFRSPSKDMLFDITCKSDHTSKREMTGQAIDRTWTDSGLGVPDLFPDSLSNVYVNLRILDTEDREVSAVRESAPIKLDAVLIDEQSRFNGISIEQCFASNHSYRIKSSNNFQELLLNYKGCPVSNSGFTAQFIQAKNGNRNHLQSTLFPAFRMGKIASVFFKCILRICKHRSWCQSTSNCENPHAGILQAPQGEDNIKIVVRWAHIEVRETQSYRTITIPHHDEEVCSFSVCLTTTQIVIIATFITAFCLITCCIALIIYRRRETLRAYQTRSVLLDARAVGMNDATQHHCLHDNTSNRNSMQHIASSNSLELDRIVNSSNSRPRFYHNSLPPETLRTYYRSANSTTYLNTLYYEHLMAPLPPDVAAPMQLENLYSKSPCNTDDSSTTSPPNHLPPMTDSDLYSHFLPNFSPHFICSHDNSHSISSIAPSNPQQNQNTSEVSSHLTIDQERSIENDQSQQSIALLDANRPDLCTCSTVDNIKSESVSSYEM